MKTKAPVGRLGPLFPSPRDLPVRLFVDDMPDGQHLPPVKSDDSMTRAESVRLIRHYCGILEAVRRQV